MEASHNVVDIACIEVVHMLRMVHMRHKPASSLYRVQVVGILHSFEVFVGLLDADAVPLPIDRRSNQLRLLSP